MFFFKKKQEKQIQPPQHEREMYATVEENVSYIREKMVHTEDLVVKEIYFHKRKGKLIFLETLVNSQKMEENFLKPLYEMKQRKPLKEIITNADLKTTTNLDELLRDLMQGSCIFIAEKEDVIYSLKTAQEHSRSPEEPENERAVRGSHTGFVENLDVNINLIRRQIKNPQLKVRYFQLGNETHTRVAMVYLDHLADPTVVKEVEEKVKNIPVDIVFAPGFLEEYVEEKSVSPFPQNLYTERPDRTASNLVEGRVVLMGEGSTDAIIMPVTFFSFFQTTDDYNNRIYQSTVFRMIRLFSFWGALLLPPLYIAVIVFHFEIIPYEIVTLVKRSIETVPFSPFFEALFMALTIELVREAGIRLPSPIGETIGIVGGLIIGEAVVNVGLVSNVMVIVIALTAIMSFTAPSYELGNTARMLSLPIMLSAAMFGFVGIVFSMLFILIHLCTLHSFGTPYLSPLVPINFTGMKDALVRMPVWSLKKRPEEISPQKTDKLQLPGKQNENEE